MPGLYYAKGFNIYLPTFIGTVSFCSCYILCLSSVLTPAYRTIETRVSSQPQQHPEISQVIGTDVLCDYFVSGQPEN